MITEEIGVIARREKRMRKKKPTVLSGTHQQDTFRATGLMVVNTDK